MLLTIMLILMTWSNWLIITPCKERTLSSTKTNTLSKLKELKVFAVELTGTQNNFVDLHVMTYIEINIQPQIASLINVKVSEEMQNVKDQLKMI